jgi:hypothetical protein
MAEINWPALKKISQKTTAWKKTNPSFNFLSSFSLSNPFFAQTITIAIVIAIHCKDLQQFMQPALSPPLPPPPSIIIIIVMIKIIISIHHAAASNASLLPPPPTRCCCISKCAAATAKIALPPSCRLYCQADRRHHAHAAATSANTWQPPHYHCLQNK